MLLHSALATVALSSPLQTPLNAVKTYTQTRSYTVADTVVAFVPDEVEALGQDAVSNYLQCLGVADQDFSFHEKHSDKVTPWQEASSRKLKELDDTSSTARNALRALLADGQVEAAAALTQGDFLPDEGVGCEAWESDRKSQLLFAEDWLSVYQRTGNYPSEKSLHDLSLLRWQLSTQLNCTDAAE